MGELVHAFADRVWAYVSVMLWMTWIWLVVVALLGRISLNERSGVYWAAFVVSLVFAAALGFLDQMLRER